MSLSKEMAKALEEEKKDRMLGSLHETLRSIAADYFVIKRLQQEGMERQQKKKRSPRDDKIEVKHNPLIV